MRYVGLDVHKSTVRVCILEEDGKRIFSGTIVCVRESLIRFAESTLLHTDSVALEATTNTWAVVDILRAHVGRIVISNPLRTKAIAQAKVKTGKIDAEVLAQLLRCDYLPSVWEPDDQTRQLRQLTTYRTALIGDRTRIKNRIQSLLNQRLIKSPVKYLFSKAGIEWLSQNDQVTDQDRDVLLGQLRMLDAIEREVSELDQRLQQIAYHDDQIKLLMTLPGVAHGTAVALLAALGDINRFRDGDHAASYLGLVPSRS